MGIEQRVTAAMNPRENGQVEHMNGVMKSAIRKCTTAYPGGKWWEFLAYIARSVRLLPARATSTSPYVLVFKQYPEIPVEGHLRATSSDVSLEEVGEHVDE